MKDLPKKLVTNDIFYYNSPSLALDSQYAAYPGQLRVNRIIQGKDTIFSISGQTTAKNKKTIVFCDHKYNGIKLPSLLTAINNLLSEFIDAGFDVRYWDGKKAIQIKKINDLNTKIVKYGDEKTINQRLAGDNIPKDALFHLDYFAVRKLIANKSPSLTLPPLPSLLAARKYLNALTIRRVIQRGFITTAHLDLGAGSLA